MVKLTQDERELIQQRFPDWEVTPDLLDQCFSPCYQSLQLKFDPYDYEERQQLSFGKGFVPHEINPKSSNSVCRTYSIHVDRYADPRWEGNYSGAILLVPGTGSYGGNYLKFCLTMASLKGYVVYVLDPIFHGRSHGHKLVSRNPNGDGVAVFLNRAISKDGNWYFTNGLEAGWEEKDPCQVDMTRNITVIQAIGRRIAYLERTNLEHLNAEVLSKPAENRAVEWFGKSVNALTHVTLIGTSQGGETAFWSADPRATGQGGQAAYGIYLPFDSVICHNVYHTAYTAPQGKMRFLRSGLGGVLAGVMEGHDSLWSNTDWTKLYDPTALFIRACDRWVRWRYDLEAFRNLLRFGRDHRDTLHQMRVPVLVAIGTGDRLYSSDKQTRNLVANLFEKMQRDPTGESLWHLEYLTPENTNGHQLLVNHTLRMADLTDGWIRYRRGGPGSSFQYESGTWRRVQ
jgi:pimeloyl-ACP methyl ester carboxylesterase